MPLQSVISTLLPEDAWKISNKRFGHSVVKQAPARESLGVTASGTGTRGGHVKNAEIAVM